MRRIDPNTVHPSKRYLLRPQKSNNRWAVGIWLAIALALITLAITYTTAPLIFQ
jgi:hypothetical protein